MKPCIGCGFCCRQGPCSLGHEGAHGHCALLRWDGSKWRCSFMNDCMPKEAKQAIMAAVAIGAGCCSSLNTYRRKNYVPTPEDLKDEKALLRKLEEA